MHTNKVASSDAPRAASPSLSLTSAEFTPQPASLPLSQQIYADQVAFLYRNSPVGFAVTLVAGALLAFSMHPQIAASVLLIWYAILVLITGMRFTLSYVYHWARPPANRARRWETLFLVGTAMAGLAWGSTIFVLYPADAVPYQVFLAMVLAGISAGAVAVFSARLAAYLAFAVPILLPAAVHFLAQGDSLHRILGVLTLLFLGGMMVTARNSERAFRTTLELRFDNRQLAEEIAERRRVQNELSASEERFRDFAESAADWFWEMDSDLRFTAISERFEDVAGVPREHLLGHGEPHFFAKYVEKPEELQGCLDLLFQRQAFDNLELTWTRPDQARRTFQLSAKPLYAPHGAFAGYRGVGRDVTEEHRKAKLLAYQAQHDALTGLVNRPEFTRRVEHAISRCQRDGTPCVVCYLDLDHFKLVNDTVGHAAGDELLKQIAGLFLGRIRARDTVSRLGGDEFSLLLEDCPLKNGIDLAESLVATLEDFRFRWEGRNFGVGASVGVVPIVSGDETVVQLLAQADLACYAAKDTGRNRVQVFRTEDSDLARRQDELHRVSELRDALENDQFCLYIQPIQALGSRSISHYEVLLRLQGRDHEIITPGSFIPAAERYDLMRELDRWVVRKTIMAAARGGLDNSDAALFVNLSGNSLDDDRLLRFIQENLNRAGVNAARIGFEITETTAVRHLSHAERLVQQLKSHGHCFALDDFGSGLSSFAYLKRLPVDFLKIDASFVRDMAQDATARAMVTAIKQIGQTLGIETIAEGVESENTLAALGELGVDYAQGYAVGKPIPLEQRQVMTTPNQA